MFIDKRTWRCYVNVNGSPRTVDKRLFLRCSKNSSLNPARDWLLFVARHKVRHTDKKAAYWANWWPWDLCLQ